MTDAELQAIRDDDAEWSAEDIAAEGENRGIVRMVLQRRALLSEVDRLKKHVAELEESLDAARAHGWDD